MDGLWMTREWVRFHVGLLDDEDFQALSPAGKGAWGVVNLLCGRQTDEGRFSSIEHLTRLLLKEGFTYAEVEELSRHRWLIGLDDGRIEFKGYRTYQISRDRSNYHASKRATRPGTSLPVPARPPKEREKEINPPKPRALAPEGARVDDGVRTMESLGKVMDRIRGEREPDA